jgi:hypothetical protein
MNQKEKLITIVQSLIQTGQDLASLHIDLDNGEFSNLPDVLRADQLIVAAHNTLDVAAGLLSKDLDL